MPPTSSPLHYFSIFSEIFNTILLHYRSQIMNGSPEIIRDQNGHFRHPDGYPLVVIFDSRVDEEKTSHEISWQDPVVVSNSHKPKEANTRVKSKRGGGVQPLNFVNVTRPATFDPATKKLIRTHVSRDLQRRKRGCETAMSKSLDRTSPTTPKPSTRKLPRITSSKESNPQTISLPTQLLFSLNCCATFPITMEPYMHKLIHRYISVTFEAKTTRLTCGLSLAAQSWLPLAMTDAALFHSILCGSALFWDVQMGRSESPEKCRHLKEAVHLLNTRLQDPKLEISDGTILAVAHLADFESIVGNYENCSLHMDGLCKMVEMRGGFSALNDGLKAKILRADLLPCVSTLSKPRFTAAEIRSIPLPQISPKESVPPFHEGLRYVLEEFAVNADLISVLEDLQNLTAELIETPEEFATISKLLTPIQHQLLSCEPTESGNPQDTVVAQLCHFGARMFLKTVYDFHLCLQIGIVASGSWIDSKTVQELQSCVDAADKTSPQARVLCLWIVFLGGSIVAGTRDRTWFVARLARMIMEMQICSWQDAKLLLMGFLWVDRIHESSCKDMWDEASVTVEVLFGGQG